MLRDDTRTRLVLFAAESVKTPTSALGTECQHMPPYQPHKKGKIERAFLTLEQLWLCTLPCFTGGPRQVNGALEGPLDDRARAREGYGEAAAAGAEVTLPLGIETFAHLFRQWWSPPGR